MRRREIQSFTLKLSDLKEYDAVRQERSDNIKSNQNKTDNTNMTPDSPMKLVPSWRPKTKQEIRDRIGMNS